MKNTNRGPRRKVAATVDIELSFQLFQGATPAATIPIRWIREMFRFKYRRSDIVCCSTVDVYFITPWKMI